MSDLSSKETRYLAAPGLEIEPAETGNVRINNYRFGTGLVGPTGLTELLAFFAVPRSLRELHRAHQGVARAVLDGLIEKFVLIDERDYACLRFGLLAPALSPIGRAVALDKLERPTARHGFCVLGAPTDAGGQPSSGSRAGPALIRRFYPFGTDERSPRRGDARQEKSPGKTVSWAIDFEFRRKLDLSTVELVDVGDLRFVGQQSLNNFGRRLAIVVERVIDAGLTPITLGGDHSITRFPLAVLLERHKKTGLGIIHFDAHHDLLPMPPDVMTHANPFEPALGHPALRVLFQVGLRTVEAVPLKYRLRGDPRVAYFSSYELAKRSPKQVFASLPRNLSYYLTFDIDAMSPECCPETGSPVAGGLGFYQAMELIDYAARAFRIVGADFVEVGDRGQSQNAAARVAANLVLRFILGHARSAPLGDRLLRENQKK